MKKQVTAFICIIVFNFEAIFASTDFSFKRYQVEDGLSHNTTWCSIQDSYGFLWIGTSDGMNCYDGCGNRVYRNALNNKYVLCELTQRFGDAKLPQVITVERRGKYLGRNKFGTLYL